MTVNITDAIFSRAERDPHAIAVIDGERPIDYRTLCNGVCLAAQRFRQTGWKAGDIVGISLRDSPALHLVTSLALARMGVAQVALPASDPAPLRLSRMERLGVSGVIVDNDTAATAASVTAVAADPGWLTKATDSPSVNDLRLPGGERIWIINESSGTTAEPKLDGVSHAMEDARRERQAPVFTLLPGECFLNLSALHFPSAIKGAIRCLSDGGTLTFPPAGLNYDQLLHWIDRHQVAYLRCVPLHLHQMLSAARTDTPRLPSLRILRSGTAALPVSMLKEVRARISPNVYVSYGLNETDTIVAATPDMLAEHPATVGRPLAGVELEVVDDLDRPVAPGATGHVRVRAAGIQSSYLHAEPQDQARVFRNGWCYPGDIGVRNDAGLVFIKGRADEVMNCGGIMIGPGEIESVLRQHPALTDVAAFALPSPEHQDIPAAAVVSSRPLASDDLWHFCTDRLGVRAPRIFLQVDTIPRNPMGKILRRRLTELALQKLQQQDRS